MRFFDLIVSTSIEGLDQPGQICSLTRAFTARIQSRDKDEDSGQLCL